MASKPVDVVLKLEQAINSRNPAAAAGLLAPDSVFVDSMGARVQGLEKLRAADYTVCHHGDTVAVFGSARGTRSHMPVVRAIDESLIDDLLAEGNQKSEFTRGVCFVAYVPSPPVCIPSSFVIRCSALG